MKIAGLFLVYLIPLLGHAAPVPQSDSLNLKSQQAKELMAQGNFVQAISVYRELNQAVPNNPGLKLNLGMALHMAGRKREAIPVLEEAIKLDRLLQNWHCFTFPAGHVQCHAEIQLQTWIVGH